MLGDEAALADGAARGVGDLHIGVGIGPRLLRRLEVHRHVGGLRLHQHDLLRRVGVRLILVLIVRIVVLTAAGQQRQCRQQGCARQNIPFLSHDGLLSAVRIPSADKGTHACHLMARNAGQRARCPAPLRWGYLTICRPQMQDPFDRSQRRCLIVALEHQGKLPLLHGRHPVLVGCQQGLGLRQLTLPQIAGRRAVQTGGSHGAQ